MRGGRFHQKHLDGVCGNRVNLRIRTRRTQPPQIRRNNPRDIPAPSLLDNHYDDLASPDPCQAVPVTTSGCHPRTTEEAKAQGNSAGQRHTPRRGFMLQAAFTLPAFPLSARLSQQIAVECFYPSRKGPGLVWYCIVLPP